MTGRGFTRRLARWAKRPAVEMDAAALALVADASAAERLRSHKRNPFVAALSIERQRDRLDVAGWLLLLAGLAFTTVNVAAFVGGRTGWLVEPLVMGLMLVLMRGEQIANRYHEQVGAWVRSTRRAALLITYVMNTWQAWLDGSPKQQFIHSVPVIMVFLGSEALVQQRQSLTRVVDQVSNAPVHGEIAERDLTRELPAEVAEVPAPFRPTPYPRTRPQAPAEGGAAVTEQQSVPEDLEGPRPFVERAYEAYAALRRETGKTPGPAEVDRRAGVRPGTAKVSGRMAKFGARYEREHNEEVIDGGLVDDTDAAQR